MKSPVDFKSYTYIYGMYVRDSFLPQKISVAYFRSVIYSLLFVNVIGHRKSHDPLIVRRVHAMIFVEAEADWMKRRRVALLYTSHYSSRFPRRFHSGSVRDSTARRCHNIFASSGFQRWFMEYSRSTLERDQATRRLLKNISSIESQVDAYDFGICRHNCETLYSLL